MSRSVWLTATVAHRSAVVVCVGLDEDRTVFVESGSARPEGEHVGLDDGALDLSTLLRALWPLHVESVDAHVKELRRIENRLDMEAALVSTRASIARVVSVWRQQDEGWRAARIRPLRTFVPVLAHLLDDAAVPRGGEAVARLARSRPQPATVPHVDDEHWEAWTSRSLDDVLGPEGGLARLLGEGFEVREGQRDMAEGVEKALERQEHLMVEAGTGIGKSLAYLVPALLHGARTGERVVISTHTRTLQSQLVDHDLPLLERLGYPGTVRLLLGRNNYLCRRQLRRAMRTRVEDEPTALAQFALAWWSRISPDGRREELSDHPWFEAHWRRFFESVEPCSPHICQRDPVCFVVRARRSAREAPVVIVNHALLMMDLRSGQSLVGPARVVVVDEAHQLGDVATRALSHWIAPERLEVHRNLSGERSTPGALREVFANLVRASGNDEEVETLARAVDDALETFLEAFLIWFTALESMAGDRLGGETGRPGAHRIHDPDEAFAPLRARADALRDAGRELEAVLARLLSTGGDREEHGASIGEEREGLASLLEFHREFRRQVEFCQAVDDEDWVYWLEWGGESGLRALVAAPLTVESPLSNLWNAHYRTVVMTSATMAVEHDFLPFAETVGLSKADRFTESLHIPSPFRAERQSLLLTSLGLVAPDDAHHPASVASIVAGIATAVPTKTLVLSTSYRFVTQLEEALRAHVAADDEDLFEEAPRVRPEILVQRPGQARGALAARFRDAEAAVLIATGSFWEGVDFPGRQLEVLVVPRLPFAVPTDPLVQGRTERAQRLGRDPFQDVTLVDAVLRLKQGVGRLLRTQDDRGAVLLLDQRLQSRPYGVRFLNSMPRLCEIVAEPAALVDRTVDFLRGRAGED